MKIAVIIPCRNEVKHIEECVTAIYNATLPAGAEVQVAVVDGKSNDGTLTKIEELQQCYPSLHLVHNEQQITPVAFNLGIQQFPEADYYQIVGVRQIISANYLNDAIRHFEEHPETWCVGGRVENVYLNPMGKLISAAMGTSFGMGLGNFRTVTKSGYTDTVGTPMYPKHVFEQIGYFDEVLVRNQDDDFNFRVTKAGGKVYYEHGISLKYYVRGNLKQLWRQFMQYGYWKVYVNTKHKTVTTMRQLVPPAFVCFLILLPFTFLMHCWFGLAASSGLALYLLLDLLMSAKLAGNPKEFFNLLVIYPMLHISYGWGYLKGMVAFLLFKQKPGEKAKQLSR